MFFLEVHSHGKNGNHYVSTMIIKLKVDYGEIMEEPPPSCVCPYDSILVYDISMLHCISFCTQVQKASKVSNYSVPSDPQPMIYMQALLQRRNLEEWVETTLKQGLVMQVWTEGCPTQALQRFYQGCHLVWVLYHLDVKSNYLPGWGFCQPKSAINNFWLFHISLSYSYKMDKAEYTTNKNNSLQCVNQDLLV